MSRIIAVLLFLGFLIGIVFLIAAPIVYFLRIRTNLMNSRNRINHWAKKNNFKIELLRVKVSSLFFFNFGAYTKKVFYIEFYEGEKFKQGNLVIRLSSLNSDYELISLKEKQVTN